MLPAWAIILIVLVVILIVGLIAVAIVYSTSKFKFTRKVKNESESESEPEFENENDDENEDESVSLTRSVKKLFSRAQKTKQIPNIKFTKVPTATQFYVNQNQNQNQVQVQWPKIGTSGVGVATGYESNQNLTTKDPWDQYWNIIRKARQNNNITNEDRENLNNLYKKLSLLWIKNENTRFTSLMSSYTEAIVRGGKTEKLDEDISILLGGRGRGAVFNARSAAITALQQGKSIPSQNDLVRAIEFDKNEEEKDENENRGITNKEDIYSPVGMIEDVVSPH